MHCFCVPVHLDGAWFENSDKCFNIFGAKELLGDLCRHYLWLEPMASRLEFEFERFWIETAVRIRVYMFCACENWADADDLAQECYLRALKGWHQFDGQGTRQSWLFQIARRTCSDWFRQKKRKRTFTFSHMAGDVAEPTLERQNTDDVEAIWSNIRGLEPEQSEVIHLRFAAGLSYAEIADVLRIPVGTVRSRLHRGLNSVREQIGKEENGT